MKGLRQEMAEEGKLKLPVYITTVNLFSLISLPMQSMGKEGGMDQVVRVMWNKC